MKLPDKTVLPAASLPGSMGRKGFETIIEWPGETRYAVIETASHGGTVLSHHLTIGTALSSIARKYRDYSYYGYGCLRIAYRDEKETRTHIRPKELAAILETSADYGDRVAWLDDFRFAVVATDKYGGGVVAQYKTFLKARNARLKIVANDGLEDKYEIIRRD